MKKKKEEDEDLEELERKRKKRKGREREEQQEQEQERERNADEMNSKKRETGLLVDDSCLRHPQRPFPGSHTRQVRTFPAAARCPSSIQQQ